MNDTQLIGIAQECLHSVIEDTDPDGPGPFLKPEDFHENLFAAVVHELEYEEEMVPADRIWAAIDVAIADLKEFYRLVDERNKR